MVAVPPDAADAAEPGPVDDEPLDLIDDDVEPSPDDGVENGDRLELVRTGLVRVHIGGTRYRLRRPFFGEFKTLRLAAEDLNDEIAAVIDESLRVARQVAADAKVHAEDDPDTFVAWRAEIRKRTTVAQRAVTDAAETLRIEWWQSMWTMLSLDGPLDDPPAWVTDAGVANALLTHWRSSPLGRG